MKSKNKLKETDIKNRMYFYFDDIITDRDIYSADILLDEKIYQHISVYDISYRSILLIIILEKSELIHIIYQLKKYWLSIIWLFINSVINKNKSNYYNIFLEKKVCLKINPINNIFKWMFVYFVSFNEMSANDVYKPEWYCYLKH